MGNILSFFFGKPETLALEQGEEQKDEEIERTEESGLDKKVSKESSKIDENNDVEVIGNIEDGYIKSGSPKEVSDFEVKEEHVEMQEEKASPIIEKVEEIIAENSSFPSEDSVEDAEFEVIEEHVEVPEEKSSPIIENGEETNISDKTADNKVIEETSELVEKAEEKEEHIMVCSETVVVDKIDEKNPACIYIETFNDPKEYMSSKAADPKEENADGGITESSLSKTDDSNNIVPKEAAELKDNPTEEITSGNTDDENVQSGQKVLSDKDLDKTNNEEPISGDEKKIDEKLNEIQAKNIKDSEVSEKCEIEEIKGAEELKEYLEESANESSQVNTDCKLIEANDPTIDDETEKDSKISSEDTDEARNEDKTKAKDIEVDNSSSNGALDIAETVAKVVEETAFVVVPDIGKGEVMKDLPEENGTETIGEIEDANITSMPEVPKEVPVELTGAAELKNFLEK